METERVHLHQKLTELRDKMMSGGYQQPQNMSGQGETTRLETPLEDPEEIPMTTVHKQILTRNRTALVENMVPDDLFRHLVARHTLTSAEERRIKSSTTWEDVNNRLLEVIVTRSDSAFANLIEVLMGSCQGHLAELLDTTLTVEAGGLMSQQHKDAISRNRDKLASDVTPDEIFNDFISEHVLTTAEVSRIKEKATREDKNESLLDYIIRRSDQAFDVFVDSLKKTGQEHLAKILTSAPPRLERKRKKLSPLNIPVTDMSDGTSLVVPTPIQVSSCHLSQMMTQPLTSTVQSSLTCSTMSSSIPQAKRQCPESFDLGASSNPVVSLSESSNQIHCSQSTNQVRFSESTNHIHPVSQSSNQNHPQSTNQQNLVTQATHPIISQVTNQILSFSQPSNITSSENGNIAIPESCSLNDVRQQIMLMAENAYKNIRRKDDTGEAFLQFSREMSETTESINDSLKVYDMIEKFCENREIEDSGLGQNEESQSCDKTT